MEEHSVWVSHRQVKLKLRCMGFKYRKQAKNLPTGAYAARDQQYHRHQPRDRRLHRRQPPVVVGQFLGSPLPRRILHPRAL